MAKRTVSFPLSNLTGGFNCLPDEAQADQITDGIDVWEQGGDLCRRPAMRTIAASTGFRLPAGRCVVIHEYPLNTFTNYTDRAFTVPVGRIGGSVGRLWIGADETFSGVDFRHITSTATALTANRKLAVHYRISAGVLGLAHGVVDTTQRKGSLSDETQNFVQPFMQDGHIFWHRDTLTGWALSTLNSISKYWIALDVSIATPAENATSATVDALTGAGNLVVAAPGLRVFVSSRVNGLFAGKFSAGSPVLVVGADSIPRRGREQGGVISYHRNMLSAPEVGKIVSYEGSGVIGQATKPAWSHAGAPTGTEGTANRLTKLDQTYSWRTNILDGVVVLSSTAQAGSSASSINTTVGASATGQIYEHHRLRFTSGALSGQEREIVSVGASAISVYDAFGGAPGAGDTFEIRTPPAFVQTREGGRLYEIDSNDSHTATLVTTRPYQAATATSDSQRYVNFEIGRELPWTYPSGQHYSFCYNHTTRKILFTNGTGPILEFDGVRTRALRSLYDPTNGVPGNALVQSWSAAVDEVAATLGLPQVPTFLRRQPPTGRFVVEYKGHIVVASLRDRENVLQWSAPGVFNAIWPQEYETSIRDSESSAITGIWVLNDQLFVSTVSALFASDPPDSNGRLVFRPISQGLGFVSHYATCTVPMSSTALLVGVTADGIRATTGGSPVEILDRWDRVVPGGVNVRGLANAVCGLSLDNTTIFFAVPSAGSPVNNRLVLWDWSSKKFWLWSANFGGITAIARDVLESGKEQMLFGHSDGSVSTFGPGDYEGMTAVTGRARGKPMTFEGNHMAFTGILATLQETGTQQLNIRTFINSAGSEHQKLSFAVSAGAAVFDTDLYGTGTWGKDDFKTVRLNLRAGGTDSAGNLQRASVGTTLQYEIESPKRFRLRRVELLATPKGQRHAT